MNRHVNDDRRPVDENYGGYAVGGYSYDGIARPTTDRGELAH